MSPEQTLDQIREVAIAAHQRGLGFAYDVLLILEAANPTYSRPMGINELEEPDD